MVFETNKKMGRLVLCSMTMMIGIAQSDLPARASSEIPANIGTENFYVSKTGLNSDGKTWKSAWNELDQIDWKRVLSARAKTVRIIIDGGSSHMVYNKALRAVSQVMSSSGKKIVISRSRDPEHAGRIVIDGKNELDSAVLLALPNISLDGLGWRGIVIRGFKKIGVKVAADSVRISGVELAGHTSMAVSPMIYPAPPPPPSQSRPLCGVYASGWGSFHMSGVIIHDTMQGLRVTGPVTAKLSKCWIYESAYLLNPLDQDRVSGVVSGYLPKIVIDDPIFEPQIGGPVTAPSVVQMRNCIVGPGLGRGLVSTNSSQLYASDCLLLNASDANLLRAKRDSHSAAGILSVRNMSSIITPKGRNGVISDLLRSNSEDIAVNDSLCYGGHVRLDTKLRLGSGNVQFKTTGNTAVLSKSQQDPLFVQNVYSLNEYSDLSKFIAMDYSVKRSSPAYGKGSGLVSVRQLLRSPLP